ncbi:MAG: hypothetical protein MUC59_03805 [Saprospiraceae bacterium]|nr:hypothetical protein [Saprospiraceae bacterium]
MNERLSSAIKLNLGMLYGFSMSIDEAAEFANWAFQAWASQHYLPSAATASIDRGSDFQAVYEMQKNDILPYQSAIWELLKNYQKIEKPDFVDWIHVNTNANLELSLVLDANKLRAISSNPTAPSSLWPFYADFLQKTNNRLGLLRQTEGYFLYAFAQNLKLMKKGTPQFSAQGINRAMPA